MESLRIHFDKTGARVDLEASVSGFDAVNQDALVNIGTKVGSDDNNPSRGSSLEILGLGTSAIISFRSASHLANIVSSETDRYITENEDTVEDEPLQAVDLQPIEFELQSLELEAIMTSVNGTTIGTSASLTT